MNDRHIDIDELSAYLDGEVEDAAQIAAHLDACPECARRCQDLSDAVHRVRALPAPEISPHFVSRVMAELAEFRETVTVSFRWYFYMPLAAAAVVLLLVAVGFTAYRFGARTVPPGMPGQNIVENGAADPEEQLLAAIEYRLAEGAAEMPEEDFEYVPATQMAAVNPIVDEDIAADVAGAGWLDMLAMNVDDDADVDTLLDSMDAAERESFAELLEEYLMESTAT